MKRWLATLTLMSCLSVVSVARADAVPHRQFIQGLRARHMPDLALEYCLNLASKPKLPGNVLRWLPLETARSQIEVAADAEADRRNILYEQARKNLAIFVKENAGQQLAAEAALDLARLDCYQARSQYQSARRTGNEGQAAAMALARTQFENAAMRLAEANKLIEAQKEPTPNAPWLKQLESDAAFETAVNLLDQMLTYPPTDTTKRVDIGNKALSQLKKLSVGEEKNPVTWKAKAQIVRYYEETETPSEALKQNDDILKARGAHTEEAKRISRYYVIRLVAKKPKPTTKEVADAIKQTKDWINDFPNALRTPEGAGVRFFLAEFYRNQFEQDPKASKDQLDKAQKLYEDLQDEESEYRQVAQHHYVMILLKQRPDLTKSSVENLKSFRDCYLRAKIEIAQIAEEESKISRESDAKKRDELVKNADKNRTAHHQNIVACLSRGMDKVETKDAIQDQIDARYTLIYYLMVIHDEYRAAVLGEDLARSNPQSSRAGTAGAYALYAYAQIIEKGERGGDKTSPWLERTIATDRARLRRLAEYIEKTWKTETAADVARHQLAVMPLRKQEKKQEDYVEAIDWLSKISPGYNQYMQVQQQLAKVMMQAEKEKIPPPQGQKPWRDRAVYVLYKTPEPAYDDENAVRSFFSVKMTLAKLFFDDKKYPALEKLAKELETQLGKVKNVKVRSDLEPNVQMLLLYSKLAQADALFKAGAVDRYTQVLKLLDPVIEQMKGKKLADPELQKGILGLALRCCVFEGKLDRAKVILKELQDSSGDFENQSGVFVGLVQQFSDQINELDKKGDKDEKKKVVDRFSAFLDELAKTPLDKLDPESIRFLAYSYSKLDKHKQAADMLDKVIKKLGEELKKMPNQTEEEKKLYQQKERYLHSIELMYIRELRQSDKLDDAEKLLQELEKTDFGKKSLEVRKEKNFLLMARSKYGSAAKAWNTMTNDLKPLAPKDNVYATAYTESLYQYAFCLYQYGLSVRDKDKKKCDDYIVKAARLIATLEITKQMGAMEDKFKELIEKEKLLKEKYLEALKESSNTPR